MTENKITEDMNIREVLEKHPETVSIFGKYNIGCVGCVAASFEKIKDIVVVHGVDVKAFVKDLNDTVQNK